FGLVGWWNESFLLTLINSRFFNLGTLSLIPRYSILVKLSGVFYLSFILNRILPFLNLTVLSDRSLVRSSTQLSTTAELNSMSILLWIPNSFPGSCPGCVGAEVEAAWLSMYFT
ncbi:unnamed protein product, partial [Arabidopsis halleri]